jgi:hypothetical protein
MDFQPGEYVRAVHRGQPEIGRVAVVRPDLGQVLVTFIDPAGGTENAYFAAHQLGKVAMPRKRKPSEPPSEEPTAPAEPEPPQPPSEEPAAPPEV